MQELVLCRIRTFVCSCSTDSSQLFFGRHDILVRQTVDAICSLIVMNCIGKSLMIFESCKVWCSRLLITFLTHFMWHVPLLFMYFWTQLFWMLRFSKGVWWACRPFSQTSSPGFSLFRNGPEDTLGDASGPHLCQLLAFRLSPAKVLPRPDPSLLAITVGIRH